MSLDTVSASVHPDLASHQNTMKPRIHTLKGHIHSALAYSVVNIPKIEDAAGAMAATATLVQGVVQGDLAPEDAKAVATLVETYRRTVETVDIEERITALESEPTN